MTAGTPGPGGYVLAWLVSVAVYAVIFAVGASLADGTGIGTAAAVLVVYGGFIGIVSVPFALIGAGVGHAVCRRVRAQWVHVAAAGVAGALPAALMVVIDPQRGVWLWWMIPVATAIGRWSVVPLVRAARAAS